MKHGTAPAGIWTQAQPGKSSRWILVISSALLGLVLVASLATGFYTDAARSAAQRDKATLDQTLKDASVKMHVPPSLLAPILKGEQQAGVGNDGTIGSYQAESASYAGLIRQTMAIEHMSPSQAKELTQTDLTTFVSGVGALTKGSFIEASGYAGRLAQAQSDFKAASSTSAYFKVDTFAQQQNAAIALFQPTYDRLQAFTKLVDTESTLLNGASASTGPAPLQCAVGMNDVYWQDNPIITLPGTQSNVKTLPETQWSQADLLAFRNATTAAEYASLNRVLITQMQQAQANEINLLPTAATNALKLFQSDIATAKKQNVTTTTFDQQYTADNQQAQTLATKPTVEGYTTLITTIRKQDQGLELPVLKAKTANDVAALQQLVNQGQASKTIDPANGIGYPNAYEYADPNTGVGDATQRLAYAQTLDDYNAIDTEVLSMTANIQAMLTNLNDKTPSDQAHQTDLQLLNYYHIAPYRVVVVSLREQVARTYDNGKLVKTLKVTTGAPDLPSIPGMHCVLDKQTNTVFKSPDQPGSPNYYQPTPIHYAMYYSYYGYELHDAWWRSWFGKYSNLPHYDPSAFNGGSHGCVNFNYQNGDSAWIYNWVQIGTPVVIY
ncbi:MAG TPA: L,D-transpeptidase [Ktedonobacterales bacterium]|nr:L,D-transpeptidase [Ktedonobacterales bacterium]